MMVTQAKKKDEPVRLMALGATDVVAYMNRKKEQFNHIENLYWSIAPSAIQEVIDRVRSNLVELVAEMRAGMSSGDAIPSSKLASQAVNVVIKRFRLACLGNVQATDPSPAKLALGLQLRALVHFRSTSVHKQRLSEAMTNETATQAK